MLSLLWLGQALAVFPASQANFYEYIVNPAILDYFILLEIRWKRVPVPLCTKTTHENCRHYFCNISISKVMLRWIIKQQNKCVSWMNIQIWIPRRPLNVYGNMFLIQENIYYYELIYVENWKHNNNKIKSLVWS